MNKDLKKILIKAVLFFLILWAIFAFLVKYNAMTIFDSEYAYYKQTMDYIKESNEYNKTIIMGDSVAKAAFEPTRMGDSTYNISMAGSSTVEQYYLMKEYLKHHEAPNTLIMMYYIGEIDENSVGANFWNRTTYFDCLKVSEFNEIINTGLFPNSIGAIINFWQYKLAFPTKYYAAVKNAFFDNRKEENLINYQDSIDTKGHHLFGTADTYMPPNSLITTKDHFKLGGIFEYYLYKCIELAEGNDIQVIILTHPINISTLSNMNDGFRKDYVSEMKRVYKRYPNTIIDMEDEGDFHFEPDMWFGDETHLNAFGAEHYTNKIVEKYRQYIIGE